MSKNEIRGSRSRGISVSTSKTISGFTLVELLTVIAIIALLAAIIFPVFGQIRENTRRANCISNMQKLYQATRQFELDNRRYPDYLFGPTLGQDGAILSGTTQTALSPTQVATLLRATVTSATPSTEAQVIRNVQRNYRYSLFPQYINDLSVYFCPNNITGGTANNTGVVTADRLEKDPSNPNVSVAVTIPYYRYDSYDANPTITGGQLNSSVTRVRYSRLWYPLLNRTQIDALSAADQALYKNQLVFSNPSSDTYITMCTYHANNSKIIVLWLNGQAKVLDTRKLNNVPGSTQGGIQYDFDTFKLTPTSN
jgi:prepilin-type N-terminal cleavage/methylation domain-containing protein